MIEAEHDTRSPERRALDEQIAAETPLAPPLLANGSAPRPVEEVLASRQSHVAVAGIVENGLVRPLDDSITLPERSRVIIVASEPSG